MDSEHSAVLQCVTGREAGLGRLILTASGGPFRDWDAGPDPRGDGRGGAQSSDLADGEQGDAWTAPPWPTRRWKLIEAHHLFGLGYDALDVVVHPQSIVHAFVEFCDGSVIAQLGFPINGAADPLRADPSRAAARSGVRRFDPVAAGSLTFEPVRSDVFRAFRRRRGGRARGRHRAGGVQRGQ